MKSLCFGKKRKRDLIIIIILLGCARKVKETANIYKNNSLRENSSTT